MLPHFGLGRPEDPAKGSFWEKPSLNLGYVLADPRDPQAGFIGSITRVGKQYRWKAWGKAIKPTSKLKSEPEAVNIYMARKLSDAIWSVRKHIQ